MRKPRIGVIFIISIALEAFLGLAYGYSEPFGQIRADLTRAARECADHPTPQCKEAVDTQWDRFRATDRKRNRIVLVLLGSNSALLLVLAFALTKK